MAGRRRVVLGLVAFAGLATSAGIWHDAYQIGRFCQTVEVGGSLDSSLRAAWKAEHQTYELPRTRWQGRLQAPLFVVQEGHFLCVMEADYGRVKKTRKWLDSTFRARYPRRLAQAGRG